MSQNIDKDALVDFVVTARKYETRLTEKFRKRQPWKPKNENEITSYIPGTILKLEVNVGDIVEEGDLLLILEAMKMQNRIESPCSGIVAKVNVVEGEKIPKNVVMIEIAN